MRAHTHSHACTNTHKRIQHKNVCAHKFVYSCVCVCVIPGNAVQTRICKHIHKNVGGMQTLRISMPSVAHACMHARTHARTSARARAHTHIGACVMSITYTCMHTHTHTFIGAHVRTRCNFDIQTTHKRTYLGPECVRAHTHVCRHTVAY